MSDSQISHSRLAEDLLADIITLPVVDTHSHVVREADFVSGTFDFSHILVGSYSALDLGQAGMFRPWGGALCFANESRDPVEKWRLIAPYWPKVHNTRCSMCARRAFKRFFDVNDLDEQACITISERMKDYQFEGVYSRYLQQQYGVKVSIRPMVADKGGEPHYFAPMFYLDPIAAPSTREEVEDRILGSPPAKFDDYLHILHSELNEARENGIVGIKTGMHARQRPMDFTEHRLADVERAYKFLLDNHERWDQPGVVEHLRPFYDTCFRHCFKWAAEHNLPVQVHSGLEIDQPWDGRPGSFIPCLIEFRDTRFALLHGSYPYLDELTGLARSFHNVTIDMAWLTLISGPMVEVWLDEWLEVLPPSKLMGFGGDCYTFFETCAHLEMARELFASVLARRVERGRCSPGEAVDLARLLLHDNPWDYYSLETKWARHR